MRTMRAALASVLLVAWAWPSVASAQPAAPEPVEVDAPGDAGVPEPAGVEVFLRADAASAVARGRGVAVTAGELVERIREAPGALQRSYASDPRVLRELVDRLVADRLLAVEARRRGLEQDPVVRAALERVLVARLRATVINPEAGDASAVTDAQVRQWYDAHPERFHVPERRRARVIFLTNRREAERILRLALARRRGRFVNDFRELATRYNADPALRATAGELRDVTATTALVDPVVRQCIFLLAREGDVAPRVVAGRLGAVRGWYLVRLIARRPAIERSFQESAEWIRQRLVLERRVAVERAWAERLEREAGVARVPVEQVLRFDAGTAATVAGAGGP